MSQPELQSSNGRIELPGDKGTKLFVLAMAMHYSLLKNNTKTVYELEVANQEIQSLSNLPRDVHRARVRDLAARKRHYGALENIPNENIIKRPPNWFLAVVVFGGLGIVAALFAVYPSYYAGIAGFWAANSGYIIVGVLLFFALLLVLRVRRRRANQG